MFRPCAYFGPAPILVLRLRAGAVTAPLGAAALWAAASLHRSAGAAASAKAAPNPTLAAAYLQLIDVLARVSCAGEPAAKKGDTLTLIRYCPGGFYAAASPRVRCEQANFGKRVGTAHVRSPRVYKCSSMWLSS